MRVAPFSRTAWLAALLLVVLAVPASAAPGVTELVSISTSGQQGNNISGRFAGPAINANGQVVAFDSIATTLVSGDTNQVGDVFVRDRGTNVTERVSIRTGGLQGNGFSGRPALNATGSLVTFDSSATNLVLGDTNSLLDVFVHDRTTDTTSRISVSSEEVQGNGSSNSPSIDSEGRFVSFVSSSSNLVPDDTNGVEDIFVRDLVAGVTERVSFTSTGQQANSSNTLASISADGRWVAFQSFANNLVPGDTNDVFDVFIHDRETGLTELVSLTDAEGLGNDTSSNPTVSGDGRLVAFESRATNLVAGDTNDRVDVFVRDRLAGTTVRVSVNSDEQQANGTSQEPGVRGLTVSSPDITSDGHFVAFFSSATNLVPDDTNTCPPNFDAEAGRCPDVFVRDLVAGTTVRVSVASDGTQSNERSSDPAISEDGAVVAFFSAAGNLVPGDTNLCPGFLAFPGNCPDIFVHTSGTGPPPGGADVAVAITDSPDPVSVGSTLTYSIAVTNLGPDPASGVSLTDNLPIQVRFVGVTTTAGTCTAVGRAVNCSLGTLSSGTTATVTITVTATRAGRLATNTVSVSSTSTDPVAANNTDIETTAIKR